MSKPKTESVQIIEKGGKPLFAVLPYEEYLVLVEKTERAEKPETTPKEVAKMIRKDNMIPIRAWRTHLGLSQAEVAKRAGVSQASLSRIERTRTKPRKETLKKLATAMELTVEQLAE